MQTEKGLKIKRMNQLKWCLEQLKFFESILFEEEFYCLYRYIYDTFLKMDGLGASEANEYFLKRMRKKDIIDTLKRCNIELEV